MRSNVIVYLSLFSIVCLILGGSLVIHMSIASAAGPGEQSPVLITEDESPFQSSDTRTANRLDTPPEDAPPAVTLNTLTIDEEYLVQADSLQRIFTKVHVLFPQNSARINDEMIPYIADIITYINQVDDITFEVSFFEPDVKLSKRRAQALIDVLRLNILTPSCLLVSGYKGPHGVRVSVSM